MSHRPYALWCEEIAAQPVPSWLQDQMREVASSGEQAIRIAIGNLELAYLRTRDALQEHKTAR